MEGISIIEGSYRINYRDAREVKQKGNILTFKTSVTCLGNGKTDDGYSCQKQLSGWVYSGLENCIPNPVLIEYRSVENESKITFVKVHMEHFEGFETIESK